MRWDQRWKRETEERRKEQEKVISHSKEERGDVRDGNLSFVLRNRQRTEIQSGWKRRKEGRWEKLNTQPSMNQGRVLGAFSFIPTQAGIHTQHCSILQMALHPYDRREEEREFSAFCQILSWKMEFRRYSLSFPPSSCWSTPSYQTFLCFYFVAFHPPSFALSSFWCHQKERDDVRHESYTKKEETLSTSVSFSLFCWHQNLLSHVPSKMIRSHRMEGEKRTEQREYIGSTKRITFNRSSEVELEKRDWLENLNLIQLVSVDLDALALFCFFVAEQSFIRLSSPLFLPNCDFGHFLRSSCDLISNRSSSNWKERERWRKLRGISFSPLVDFFDLFLFFLSFLSFAVIRGGDPRMNTFFLPPYHVVLLGIWFTISPIDKKKASFVKAFFTIFRREMYG